MDIYVAGAPRFAREFDIFRFWFLLGESYTVETRGGGGKNSNSFSPMCTIFLRMNGGKKDVANFSMMLIGWTGKRRVRQGWKLLMYAMGR